jgi:hypothetical protein
MVATRRNRTNGPVSRLTSPVNEGLGLGVNVGSRVLRTGNSVLHNLGTGARGIVRNAASSLNRAGRRLLTGKRGGSRRNRSRKNRKDRKNRH